ncbi:hypothetical protein PC116_g3779 [Phytophthora cactorum]|nr:hypothetical protein Pcac1_g24098 [Phytophthora cactorum]KAG4248491.1 hypothetical protein PC116_g3779 [Phytophthora cactorum]
MTTIASAHMSAASLAKRRASLTCPTCHRNWGTVVSTTDFLARDW